MSDSEWSSNSEAKLVRELDKQFFWEQGAKREKCKNAHKKQTPEEYAGRNLIKHQNQNDDGSSVGNRVA